MLEIPSQSLVQANSTDNSTDNSTGNSTEGASFRVGTATSWYFKVDNGIFECCEEVSAGPIAGLFGKTKEVCGCEQCPEYDDNFNKVCEAPNHKWDCINYDFMRQGNGCRPRSR